MENLNTLSKNKLCNILNEMEMFQDFEENKRYNKTELISLITEWLTEDPDSPCVDDYDVVKHLLTYYSHIIYS